MMKAVQKLSVAKDNNDDGVPPQIKALMKSGDQAIRLNLSSKDPQQALLTIPAGMSMAESGLEALAQADFITEEEVKALDAANKVFLDCFRAAITRMHKQHVDAGDCTCPKESNNDNEKESQ
ncbi:MAG: hypothetical protein WAK55_17460 [Xanthobacteraceae bacterium]